MCQAVRSHTIFDWTTTVLTQLQNAYDEQSVQQLTRFGYGDMSHMAGSGHKKLLDVCPYHCLIRVMPVTQTRACDGAA